MVPLARKPTVLVVEDDAALRTFYSTELGIAGYRVIAVEDGIDALRRIDVDIPDLVILDIDLPRLPGLDVKAELKSHADTRAIPIMVVSGTETRNLDPDDFACVMRKPVTGEELIAAVEECLRTYLMREKERERERRTGLRCPWCGNTANTRETVVKAQTVVQTWRCAGCDSVWPERRKAS